MRTSSAGVWIQRFSNVTASISFSACPTVRQDKMCIRDRDEILPDKSTEGKKQKTGFPPSTPDPDDLPEDTRSLFYAALFQAKDLSLIHI